MVIREMQRTSFSKWLLKISASFSCGVWLLTQVAPAIAADGLDLSLVGAAQDLQVKTSRRLNYGILPRYKFDNPSMTDLLKETQMVEPQEAFFDLSKLSLNEWKFEATLDSITTASTLFPLASLG